MSIWYYNYDFRLMHKVAKAILNGCFSDQTIDLHNNPTALRKFCIYVPTQRSSQALQDAFLEVSKLSTVILPDIHTLGSIEQFENLEQDAYDTNILNLPAINSTNESTVQLKNYEKTCLMVQMINANLNRKKMAKTNDFLKTELQLANTPLSTSSVFSLANTILTLINIMNIEEINKEQISNLLQENMSLNQQLTLSLLDTLSNNWHEYCLQYNIIQEGKKNVQATNRACLEIEKNHEKYFVLIGSTGSLPATRRLMNIIGSHKRGTLLLPHLDFLMEKETWANLNYKNYGDQFYTHPQYGLKVFFDEFKINQQQVKSFNCKGYRTLLASKTMSLTVSHKDKIQLDNTKKIEKECQNMAIVETSTEEEEAQFIACLIASILNKNEQPAEKQNKIHYNRNYPKVALITSSYKLSRRVQKKLDSFNFTSEHIIGQRLIETSIAQVFKMIANLGLGKVSKDLWITALGSKFLNFNQVSDNGEQLVNLIDQLIIRKIYFAPSLKELAQWCNKLKAKTENLNKQTQFEFISKQLKKIQDALAPMLRLEKQKIKLYQIIKVHLKIFSLICAKDIDKSSIDYKNLIELTNKLSKKSHQTDFIVNINEYDNILSNLLNFQIIEQRKLGDNRLAIWGRFESRTLGAENVIVANLNEGAFPQVSNSDPFLSAAVRKKIGIHPIEKFISLAAHDFCRMIQSENVVLTRAKKVDGRTTTRSRFLDRLSFACGEDNYKNLITQGKMLTDSILPKINENYNSVIEYMPSPGIHIRPNKLSVTEIKTLINNPFAIYAKHILHLTPLPKLTDEFSAALFGSIVHQIFYLFTRRHKNTIELSEKTLVAHLLTIAQEYIENLPVDDNFKSEITIRIARIADMFVKWHINLAKYTVKAEYEKSYSINLEEVCSLLNFEKQKNKYDKIILQNFKLKTRIDRLNLSADQNFSVIDYKTGQAPTNLNSIISGKDPQLLLEALIILLSNNKMIQNETIKNITLNIINVSGMKIPFDECKINVGQNYFKVIQQVGELLLELINYYNNEQSPYRYLALQNNNKLKCEYAHLSRIHEWG